MCIWLTHLDPDEVLWFEIVGRATTPVHDVLVLTLAAQLTIPVGDTQVVVHESVAHVAVPEHSVEERLPRESAGVISAVQRRT